MESLGGVLGHLNFYENQGFGHKNRSRCGGCVGCGRNELFEGVGVIQIPSRIVVVLGGGTKDVIDCFGLTTTGAADKDHSQTCRRTG